MSDVNDRVREAVEDDIFLLVPLARGIVNHAALARWLQKHEGIGGEPDSIAKYLRDYTPSISDLQEPRAWEALEGAAVVGNGAVSVLTAVRSEETGAGARGVLNLVDVERMDEVIRLVPSEGELLFVVSREDDQAVIDAFEPRNIRRLERDLTEYAVAPISPDIPLGRLLGVIIDALTSRGIDLRYALTGASECIVLVPEEQGNATLDLLTQLVIDVNDPDPPSA